MRTLDEFFNRMIIIDRRVAVIPDRDDLSTAVAVREPAVVGFLVDTFERSWERARPFTNKETTTLKDIAVEQRAMTIRMLIEGHSDPVSAKRLGVSPRTYAGYVADLKTEYEAETRFQLGYAMGQAGRLGQRARRRRRLRRALRRAGVTASSGRQRGRLAAVAAAAPAGVEPGVGAVRPSRRAGHRGTARPWLQRACGANVIVIHTFSSTLGGLRARVRRPHAFPVDPQC